ncbi:hypothetical protein BpHYR1_013921 [Brachionus plicatilis]|uniref:Uncharacterized protein n=1 Tax=Brachionus plicatilis TaxID=10195 RepID=A0A3M7R4M5_BRAPC|nr:hypothetical protein BpHYR1_013921 [Brachionus plicatilis]
MDSSITVNKKNLSNFINFFKDCKNLFTLLINNMKSITYSLITIKNLLWKTTYNVKKFSRDRSPVNFGFTCAGILDLHKNIMKIIIDEQKLFKFLNFLNHSTILNKFEIFGYDKYVLTSSIKALIWPKFLPLSVSELNSFSSLNSDGICPTFSIEKFVFLSLDFSFCMLGKLFWAVSMIFPDMCKYSKSIKDLDQSFDNVEVITSASLPDMSKYSKSILIIEYKVDELNHSINFFFYFFHHSFLVEHKVKIGESKTGKFRKRANATITLFSYAI